MIDFIAKHAFIVYILYVWIYFEFNFNPEY